MAKRDYDYHTDPKAAPDLVERVAQMVADYCCADEVEEFERDLARAVVALVLTEAANLAQDMDLGEGTNPYAWPERISEAIRALIPEAKP